MNDFNLLDFIIENDNGTFVDHPLCFCKINDATDLNLINISVRNRLKCDQIAKERKQYKTMLFLRVPKTRLKLLIQLLKNGDLSISDALLFARQTWIQQSSIFELKEVWIELLSMVGFNDKYGFMSELEKARFMSLPEKMTVYRACLKGTITTGISWSISRKTAANYARKYNNTRICKGLVNKIDVFSLILSRNDNELIILDQSKVVRHTPVFRDAARASADMGNYKRKKREPAF